MTGCRILISFCSDHLRGLCPYGLSSWATESELGYTNGTDSAYPCTCHRVENGTCFYCFFLCPYLHLRHEI